MKASVLLLGGAMLAASAAGAFAKDAVVADQPGLMQPDNVDACAAYGAGFSKLPGTDTCFRVGGQVRYDQQVYGKSSHTGSRRGSTLEFETRSDP